MASTSRSTGVAPVVVISQQWTDRPGHQMPAHCTHRFYSHSLGQMCSRGHPSCKGPDTSWAGSNTERKKGDWVQSRDWWSSQYTYLRVWVQLLSRDRLFVTPWTAARQASLSIINFWSLPKLMSIELVMPSNHLIFCRPLLLPPSIFPSIRVFSNESALRTRWPNYWSFSFNISPSNELPGLISFRMDWLDLRAVQGTLKSL